MQYLSEDASHQDFSSRHPQDVMTSSANPLAPHSISMWATLASLVISDLQNARQTLHNHGLTSQRLFALRELPNANEPYGRKILFASENYEVMLATWSPNAPCAPHDHGQSNGAVWLVEGDFFEQHYVLSGDLEKSGSPIQYAQDSVIIVSPGDIHSMHSPTGGMSLHFYSPAVHAMKVFDRDSRRTLTLADDCGAWLPSNPEKIVSQITWPNR